MVGPLRPAKAMGKSYNSLFTVIDSYSKFAWAIPTTTSATAVDVAHMFTTYGMPFTGVPEQLVTDRGSVFIQHFFTELIACIA